MSRSKLRSSSYGTESRFCRPYRGKKLAYLSRSYVIVGLITQNLTYLRRRFVSVPNLYVGMYVVRWAVLAGRGNFFRNEWLWLKQEFAMSNELNSFSRKFERSSSFLSGMKFYVFLCEIGWSCEESFANLKDGRRCSRSTQNKSRFVTCYVTTVRVSLNIRIVSHIVLASARKRKY